MGYYSSDTCSFMQVEKTKLKRICDKALDGIKEARFKDAMRMAKDVIEKHEKRVTSCNKWFSWIPWVEKEKPEITIGVLEHMGDNILREERTNAILTSLARRFDWYRALYYFDLDFKTPQMETIISLREMAERTTNNYVSVSRDDYDAFSSWWDENI